MRGGWRGPMGSVGGIPRTYGLHRHFSRPESQEPGSGISRARLRRIAGYFKPYWKTWLIILGCILLSAGLGVLPPLCVAAIIDTAIPEANNLLLAMLCGAMVGLAIASGLVGVLQQTLTAKAGQGIIYDLRNQLYRHLQRMSLHFYTTTRSGEIVSRINNDVTAVQNVATRTIVTIASNTAVVVVTATTLLSMNWRLSIVAVLVVPAFYVPSRIVGRIRRRLSGETQESQSQLLGFMNERLHVSGAILTNIFGQRKADAEAFSGYSQHVCDLVVRQTVVGRWLFMILGVFSAAGPAIIYWYGGLEVIREDLSVGELVAFAALLTLLYRPLVQLATVYVDIQASFAVFDRIFEYLDLAPRVTDPGEPAPLAETQGHIVFRDVRFAYPTTMAAWRQQLSGEAEETSAGRQDDIETFALQGISFEIRPGQRVALVGPSGAGKTTITYLLPRFYDPDAGAILLDGRDLRDYLQEDLRRHIGMVTQETFLFHASIRENLLYARPDATQEEILHACRAANIHEFIDSLPQKYDTIVGERGFRLSGGEKQRVSIARALLKDPSILILDEATSSLDATSEHLIQQALETLLEGRTSLIIAHRLSTILHSDTIVVMDEGQIVESGRHEELLENRSLYATLFRRQFGRVLGPGENPDETN